MLVFCLAMQDLGIAGQGDNMTSILVKLQDIYIMKACEYISHQVEVALKEERYVPVEVINDDEFQQNVEKFEFELFDYFRSNKITGA